MSTKTLYERLEGYDSIVAVSGDLLPRLMSDSRLKHFFGTSRRGRDRPRKATPDRFSLREFWRPHVLHRTRYESVSKRDEDQ